MYSRIHAVTENFTGSTEKTVIQMTEEACRMGEETEDINAYLKRLHVPEWEWEEELAWYKKRAGKAGVPVICFLKAAAGGVEELVAEGYFCWVTETHPTENGCTSCPKPASLIPTTEGENRC